MADKKERRAERLKEVIKMRGYSMYKFAQDMHQHYSTVKDWCSGKNGITQVIDDISALLEIECGYLVGDDDFAFPDYETYISVFKDKNSRIKFDQHKHDLKEDDLFIALCSYYGYDVDYANKRGDVKDRCAYIKVITESGSFEITDKEYVKMRFGAKKSITDVMSKHVPLKEGDADD